MVNEVTDNKNLSKGMSMREVEREGELKGRVIAETLILRLNNRLTIVQATERRLKWITPPSFHKQPKYDVEGVRRRVEEMEEEMEEGDGEGGK